MYKRLILVLAAISFSIGAVAATKEAEVKGGRIEDKIKTKAMVEQSKGADFRQQNEVAVSKFLADVRSNVRENDLDFIADPAVRKKLFDMLKDDTQSTSQKYVAGLIISLVHEGRSRSSTEKEQIQSFIINTPELLDMKKNEKNTSAEVAVKVFSYSLRTIDSETGKKYTVEKAAEKAIAKAFPELKGKDLMAKVEEFLNNCLAKAKS